MTYRDSEAYRRSDKRDPTTGERIWPLPPMGKRREEMEAAELVGKVARIGRKRG